MAQSIWNKIYSEVSEMIKQEPQLTRFFKTRILNHNSFSHALAYVLSHHLANESFTVEDLNDIFLKVLESDTKIPEKAQTDISAICARDPACNECSIPLLYFKGFKALQGYRIAHWLWNNKQKHLAFFMQSRITEVFAVDIHPAAKIGEGIFFDHATSIVVGETAVIEDNVSILHEVTLGGTGKETGDRHPKVRKGVLISAGAKVLGNVEIGEGAKIGAGSVVLENIPPHKTAVGIPATVIGTPQFQNPALEMDHRINKKK